MKKTFKLIVPAVTPIKNNQVDTGGLIKLIDFLIENGVDAVFLLGTTGEFDKMTLEQKKDVISVLDHYKDRQAQFLIGISAHSVEETLELADISARHKADAVVFAPLFEIENVRETLTKVAGHSELPIMLYNNPAIHGGRNMEPVCVEEIASYDKIIGIKDSSGDFDYFKQIARFESENFQVYQGRDGLFFDSMDLGVSGLVSGTANVFPGEFKTLCGEKNETLLEQVITKKEEIKTLSASYYQALKYALVDRRIIATAEMFE